MFCKFLTEIEYNYISFCEGSFYDDSPLRPLSSRTEHSRLVVDHCRNSNTVRSRFATVRFTTIHLYDPCQVGPSIPDLWWITVASQTQYGLVLRRLVLRRFTFTILVESDGALRLVVDHCRNSNTVRSRFRRFDLRRFTFTTLVKSDRAFPTCGGSLSQVKHSRVSFCDGSFYDDSLLRFLSSRTEHSDLWWITVATQTQLGLVFDGSIYDNSLLRPLSSRTEHFRLVVDHCQTLSNWIKHSRVSFCDGSFYDDSLLLFLSSRTEHSDLWWITVATQTQLGLVLRRFDLRRFTFTTLAESDQALPTFGGSLSQVKHSKVSFCDGSFWDDSLLRPMSSRTEHSRLMVSHCRNLSILSVLSALLALFRCACVSSFSILVHFF